MVLNLVIWGAFSVANPTIQRFFALHYLCPFILAALVVMHLMALHVHGSTNPLGISNNIDRLPFHGYFVFKDLVTVFLFLLIFCLFVFFSPNTLGQKWPLIIILSILFIMNYAICWKYLFTIYNKTNNISDNLNNFINLKLLKKYYPLLVKYYYKEYNQPQTKIIKYIYYYIFNILVDCSETTRVKKIKYLLSNYPLIRLLSSKSKNTDNKFNEWLAGLIDGDGSFGITSKKYTNCEITVALEDEKMLKQIQHKFGGSIKLRSGVKAIRYRLQNKQGMIKLINTVNGNIRHSKRLTQLYQVCNLLNIEVIKPKPLTINNGWFIGFFDADGTINYYIRDKENKNRIRPQLIISVSNKYLHDIEYFKEIFGGNIYFDKSKNGCYKWVISNEILHNKFYNYHKLYSSKSFKGQRIFLIKEFYNLYNKKAIRSDINSLLYKAWIIFDKKWNKLHW